METVKRAAAFIRVAAWAFTWLVCVVVFVWAIFMIVGPNANNMLIMTITSSPVFLVFGVGAWFAISTLIGVGLDRAITAAEAAALQFFGPDE